MKKYFTLFPQFQNILPYSGERELLFKKCDEYVQSSGNQFPGAQPY